MESPVITIASFNCGESPNYREASLASAGSNTVLALLRPAAPAILIMSLLAVVPSASSWPVSESIVPIEISLVNLDSAGNLNMEETFERLALQWKVERGSSSSLYDLVACPAYQSILALGQPVIPFILQRLRTEGDAPDQWFWALHKLTGVNPIPEEHEGNYRRMKEDWINWAASQHHGR